MLQHESPWKSAHCFQPIPISIPHDFGGSAGIASYALGSHSQAITRSKQQDSVNHDTQSTFNAFFADIFVTKTIYTCFKNIIPILPNIWRLKRRRRWPKHPMKPTNETRSATTEGDVFSPRTPIFFLRPRPYKQNGGSLLFSLQNADGQGA